MQSALVYAFMHCAGKFHKIIHEYYEAAVLTVSVLVVEYHPQMIGRILKKALPNTG
jgi:hypothetical protein